MWALLEVAGFQSRRCLFGEAVVLAVADTELVGVGLGDAVWLAVALVEPLGVGVGVELPLEVADADVVGVGLSNKLLQAACFLTMACAWWRRF